MTEWVWSTGSIILVWKPKYLEVNLPQCTVSTTNPTWTVLVNVQGFHLEVQQGSGDLQDWCFVSDSVGHHLWCDRKSDVELPLAWKMWHNKLVYSSLICWRPSSYIPYPTAFPYGNGMVPHFYQQQESSTTKTVHRVINKGLKAYV